MMTMYISPYRQLANMRDIMERFIDESIENVPAEREYRLAVDVKADDESFTLRAFVPGLDADDLNIEVLKNTVTIRGEFKCEDEEDVKYLNCELPIGRFARTITLPVDVDPNKVEASMNNGVLYLRIPKAEEHLPKTIKIKVD